MTIQEHEIALEVEFKRFIEFGLMLDKRMRSYLVQYLKNKLSPGQFVIPALNETYYRYLQKALDRIFKVEGLLELTGLNKRLKTQIVYDILYWIKKAYRKSKVKNPFEEELQRLQGWAVTPLHVFVKRWTSLPPYLATIYERKTLDHVFYREKFKKTIGNSTIEEISETEKNQIDLLFNDLLAQWDALLNAKIIEFQLSKFSEEEEDFIEFLDQKVKEYNKIRAFINPFTDYLGWDISRKLWKKTSFDILNNYDKLLGDEPSLKKLADLLGKMRQAELEIEEEQFEKTIIRQRWIKDPLAKAEINGVTTSDDLTNVLTSEVGMLGEAGTELIFLKKYADKKLNTFQFEEKILVQDEDHRTEINRRVNQKEKGPFIICVDTSESMFGRPEQIAKVLTMGILKMAMHQRRKAYLINFSIGIQCLDLHDIANSIEDITAFLQMSFNGGTDASPALSEAIRQLESDDYKDADILMVSDFIMSKLDRDVMTKVRYHQQNNNTQFHSLTLGKNANQYVLEFFDTNWMYEPSTKGIIKSLTVGFHTIMERY